MCLQIAAIHLWMASFLEFFSLRILVLRIISALNLSWFFGLREACCGKNIMESIWNMVLFTIAMSVHCRQRYHCQQWLSAATAGYSVCGVARLKYGMTTAWWLISSCTVHVTNLNTHALCHTILENMCLSDKQEWASVCIDFAYISTIVAFEEFISVHSLNFCIISSLLSRILLCIDSTVNCSFSTRLGLMKGLHMWSNMVWPYLNLFDRNCITLVFT